MKMNPQSLKIRSFKGFALIATILLMVLLTILALGILSLSAVTLRTNSQNQAIMEARANARLALQIAIGELQKHTGADTRITAPSTIVELDSPPIVGAWRSWEGLDHEISGSAIGRPIKPDYSIKELAVGDGNGRFLSWLISGAKEGEDINTPSNLAFSTAEPDGSTVPLLASGSLGTNPGQIHVRPEFLENETGAFAWWVSGENQKARLMQPYEPKSNDAAGLADLAKSHATPDPSPFGLDPLLDDPEAFRPDPNDAKLASKAISRQTTALLVDNNPSLPQSSFHDLSTSAVGLLTNSATGGWRKDLSILTEKWDEIYSAYSDNRLPLFRYLPEAGGTSTSLVPKPTENNYDPDQSGFYPWSQYDQFGANKLPLTYHTAVASWQSLVNFATKYQSIDANTASTSLGWSFNVTEAHNNYTIPDRDFFKHYHGMELNPVLARTQLIIQANALPDLDPDNILSNPQLYHRVNLRVVPFFTLWNPYNVEITKTQNAEFGITGLRSLPLALSVTNDTVPPANDNFKLLNSGRQNGADGNIGRNDTQIGGDFNGNSMVHYTGGVEDLYAWLPRQFTLKPGEVKIFSAASDPPPPADGSIYYMTIALKEGYEVGDSFGMPLANPENMPIARNATPSNSNPNPPQRLADRFVKVTGRPDHQLHPGDRVKFSVKADRRSRAFTDSITGQSGAGALFGIGTHHSPYASGGLTAYESGKTNLRPNRFQSMQTMSVDTDWAGEYWPADELLPIVKSVGELSINNPNNPPWINLFSVSFGPRLTFGGSAGDAQNRPTKGLVQTSPFVNSAFSIPEKTANNHPVNGAYDIAYNSFTDGSPYEPTPGVDANDTLGYIATGFQLSDGLSRLIMAEIPLRPMASLAELQSWNLRGSNPLPPQQFALIGNSDATPLIRQDGILPENPVSNDPALNLQHDDAYCANHLLFDDWFLSSIAPQPTTFGNSIAKDIETVYQDFLMGDSPLTNRAYRPIGEDQNLSESDASERVDEILESPDGDGWLKVASRFEVDGMFNVNSTSIKAWRALLGHARNQQIAFHGENGIELDSVEHNHVVSRHTVAADVKAGEEAGLGAAFASGSEYSGFRTLSSTQLDELAVRIFDQVRLRGPFLSLSEFVNRQLSSDDDLALTGADDNLALTGALQAALNNLTEDPNEALSNPGKGLSSETIPADDDKLVGAGYSFAEASEGTNTYGFPGWIRQADILRPIAPVLSARDDTFTIRAYGDARDTNGNITARAWCEATVRRTRDFIDPVDQADSVDPPTSPINQSFGRKYIVTSFRWLNKHEI